ncbi:MULTISPECIES: hypothetical protein [unclassified Streptomyces]|uniref:DUF58 domain-containing protein n=1 Tax=Streptomyces sp. NBC_00060 TaxID=2975636 RepID=A0AAU2GWZ3_9ACTN
MRAIGRRTPRTASAPAYDRTWAGEARSAGGCAAVLLGLLLLIDTGAGTLTPWRAALWAGLAVLLLLVLWPARVSAAPGSLVARGPLRARAVRTDRLVSVRWSDGVAQRLVLRDAEGGRAEIDPRVLVTNPPLWRLVDAGARTSVARGTLRCGETALRQVSARVDRETARGVFRASGLG